MQLARPPGEVTVGVSTGALDYLEKEAGGLAGYFYLTSMLSFL